jgi:hypothetical protein
MFPEILIVLSGVELLLKISKFLLLLLIGVKSLLLFLFIKGVDFWNYSDLLLKTPENPILKSILQRGHSGFLFNHFWQQSL